MGHYLKVSMCDKTEIKISFKLQANYYFRIYFNLHVKVKEKLSCYMPWRRLGVEEV
jgi:hypothetical protein